MMPQALSTSSRRHIFASVLQKSSSGNAALIQVLDELSRSHNGHIGSQIAVPL
jgi:hypothetical protein